MTTYKDDPAFARPSGPAMSNGEIPYPQEGLTKRECFAVISLQGMLASGCVEFPGDKTFGDYAVQMADELIKALNKNKDSK